MEEDLRLREIFDQILGPPRRDYPGSGGWYEYNCPSCAEDTYGADNKYNLAVNFGQLYYHCWKCLDSGKLSKLIKEYGSPELYQEYKSEMERIKEAHYYEIRNGEMSIDESVFDNKEITLPVTFSEFDDTPESVQALSYLYSRGIGNDIIGRFGIGYIGNDPLEDYRFRRRVVIPSFDAYGGLNYFIARDYTGANRIKVQNAEAEKTRIIFNEEMINWYEPVTLVEGPFDHIVVPNSVPMLGKSLSEDSVLYTALMEKSRNDVNIMLDFDARGDARRLYKKLENTELKGRVRLIDCPDNADGGYDPSDFYRDYGKKGMLQLMATAYRMDEYEFDKI